VRLSEQKLKVLHETLKRTLPEGVEYEFRLFGSRLNDKRKGGDVDLYLETTGLSNEQCYRGAGSAR
jgi:hypothetical protein